MEQLDSFGLPDMFPAHIKGMDKATIMRMARDRGFMPTSGLLSFSRHDNECVEVERIAKYGKGNVVNVAGAHAIQANRAQTSQDGRLVTNAAVIFS